ncbi:MAG: tRNA (adenosine(37)-N6)-dimethylallyltransferase MiaA [Candidatus Cloacimonadaceae bacterium]|jgi:tRNA dimethylallyltransferase|nr:tRNA (adenosine(37)-N6)-dimethylallyltransferase MiaA [Candidatus Cloacimonadaceae bacterium]
MIVTIEGPTASGKTSLALKLAETLKTSIINCDSRQIYRYMDIGTAKPSKNELSRITHYLINIIDPNESYNAGFFVKDADQYIHYLFNKEQIPIVCGGSGLYLRSLLEGLFEHPPIDSKIREQLKKELCELGIAHLYERLEIVDPVFASRISATDVQRILRGLEIHSATGLTISQHWQKQLKQTRYNAFKIFVCPNRDDLYAKINARVEKMLNDGLIDEIDTLLKMGFSWNDYGLNTMGYKEFKPYFSGKSSLLECAENTAQHHRNYAKRQLTWYRKSRFDLTIDSYSFSLSDVLGEIQSRYLRFKEESGANHCQNSK